MSTMSGKKRRKYTPEYQAEAVRQVKAGDRQLSQVARELGLSMQTLWNWVYPDRRQSKEGPSETLTATGLTTTEREELQQLRRRVARLVEEREILKKATVSSTSQGNTRWNTEAGERNAGGVRGRAGGRRAGRGGAAGGGPSS